MKLIKKVRFVYDRSLKENFSKSHCLLSISLGNPLEEGDVLVSILDKIDKTFNKCTIMVADTLQRFGLYFSEDPQVAYLESKQAGKKWIDMHESYFDGMSNLVGVKFWDDYLNKPSFEKIHENIKTLYATDRCFYEAVQVTLYKFLRKKATPNTKCCLDFLLEECAVLRLIAEEGYDFEIYPSKRIPCMNYVYEKFIKNELSNKMLGISLEIKTRRSLQTPLIQPA